MRSIFIISVIFYLITKKHRYNLVEFKKKVLNAKIEKKNLKNAIKNRRIDYFSKKKK